jgi:hypothetical protein
LVKKLTRSDTFNPCIDKCTYEGSHCQGCGRSHQEIADTKKLVMSIVNFIQDQGYENNEEFVNAISKRDICAVTLSRFTGEKGAAISSQNIFLTTH